MQQLSLPAAGAARRPRASTHAHQGQGSTAGITPIGPAERTDNAWVVAAPAAGFCFDQVRQRTRAVSHRVPWRIGASAPGPELFVTDTSMGLDNYPYQCPDESHGHTKEIPDGFIHPKGQPCPLQNFSKGIFGNCCWLRGKIAANELDALGEVELGERMYSDMTCEEATTFAGELRAAADRLQTQHRDASEKPKGAGWGGTWNPEKQTWTWETYSTFDEALASVREAAEWFERVGTSGFGAVAWS